MILSYILVSLLIIVITVVAVNGYLNRQFTHYLRANVEERNRRIVAQLGTAYEASGDWTEVALMALSLAVANDVRIVLREPGGGEIFDTMEVSGLHHRSMMDMMRRRTIWSLPTRPLNGDSLKSYQITANGALLGTAQVSVPRVYDALTQIDTAFRRSVLSGSLAAALVALVVGAVFGLVTSRRIIKPLQHLTAITHKYSQGNFSERAAIARQDEIGSLGQSFNEMADQLEKLESNRRKLTSDIFHEVNTPLMAARSLVEAMEDGVLPADSSNLNTVAQELVRLSHLVSDVRSLSIAESGKLHLRSGLVDLTDIVSSLKQRWTQAFTDKSIAFTTQVPESPIMIHGDTQAVFQITSNLLSNGLKYTPAGGVVNVTLTAVDDTAQITVSDTGPGIAQEELPLVFQRFYRGTNAKSKDVPGTGVGLAITRELVDAHNGTISVSSTEGKGAVFTVTFPLAESKR